MVLHSEENVPVKKISKPTYLYNFFISSIFHIHQCERPEIFKYNEIVYAGN